MASLWEIVERKQGVKAKYFDGGPPRKGDGQVGERRSKFVTFERGSHSKYHLIWYCLQWNNAHTLLGQTILACRKGIGPL